MDNPIGVFDFGSLLIESSRDENEEQFRAYVTELLVKIYGGLPQWLKFKIGRRFEREGVFYREFLCAAGSVDSRIQLLAQQPDGLSRSIVLRGTRSNAPCYSAISSGVEAEFECAELEQVV